MTELFFIVTCGCVVVALALTLLLERGLSRRDAMLERMVDRIMAKNPIEAAEAQRIRDNQENREGFPDGKPLPPAEAVTDAETYSTSFTLDDALD